MNAPASAIPFLKKITPKTVTEAVGIDLLSLPRPVQGRVLYDLFGTISGYKQKADDKSEKGMWTQFLGRFQAVTPDGEVFDSGKTHIPVLEDIILATFMSAKESNPRTSMEVALRISIKPAPVGKPSMTGYEYDVQRLIAQSPSESDPIARLRAEAAKQQAALPGPSAYAAPAAESDKSAHGTKKR